MDPERQDRPREEGLAAPEPAGLPIQAVEETDPPPPANVALPVLLFLATVFTTLWAGAYQSNTSPLKGAWRFLMEDPASLWKGVPFAVTLLGILVMHELGHYVLSRLHRVPTSLPLFIPGPPHFIGTFGAIIRMRSPIMSRKALFDIGVAGPIAGFVVAVVALIIGLNLSNVVVADRTYGLHLGEPLLLQFLSWTVFGSLPDGYDVVLHPVGFAAWFGLFITSLNLIPLGQLDGGHVAYALWGDRQRTIAMVVVPTLIVLGFVGWQGWFVWAGLAGLMGFTHPPVHDPGALLGRTRVWVGRGALLIFAITFAPVPFSVH